MKKSAHHADKSQPQTGPVAPSSGTESSIPSDPATMSPNQLEDLKTRAAKSDEHWDRLLRTAADFDNFKKRAAREKQDAIKYANQELINRLVPILDSLDNALSAVQTAGGDNPASLQEGVAMIHQQFKKALAEAGVEELDATGQQFDPNWHEAVAQQEKADVPEGQVIAQLRKGYRLQDRLLRPASVVVARRPDTAPDDAK